MADWCPAPEDRNVIVGVAVTFVYAIDSFANGQSIIPHILPTKGRTLDHCNPTRPKRDQALTPYSPHLPSVGSSKLLGGLQGSSRILRRLSTVHWAVQIQRLDTPESSRQKRRVQTTSSVGSGGAGEIKL